MIENLPLPKPKQSRRSRQLSLRNFLLLTLIIGSGLGFVLKERLENAKIKTDITALRKWGFLIHFEQTPKQSGLVDNLLGKERSEVVKRAYYGGDPMRDAGMKQFVELLQPSYDTLLINSFQHAGREPVKSDLGVFDRLTPLASTFLSNEEGVSFGMKHLTGMKKLENLTLRRELSVDLNLGMLSKLVQLAYLKLTIQPDRDIWFDHLTHLLSLEAWYVEWVTMPQETLQHFSGFNEVEFVNFSCHVISDADLKYLKNLTRLETLDLCVRQVTNGGLANLKDLKNLKSLFINRLLISDSALEYLGTCKSLRFLSVCGQPISDVGLGHISALTSLRSLNLDKTEITDSGLEHLKSLTQLEELSLRGTKVTECGVAELQLALPNCWICCDWNQIRLCDP